MSLGGFTKTPDGRTLETAHTRESRPWYPPRTSFTLDGTLVPGYLQKPVDGRRIGPDAFWGRWGVRQRLRSLRVS